MKNEEIGIRNFSLGLRGRAVVHLQRWDPRVAGAAIVMGEKMGGRIMISMIWSWDNALSGMTPFQNTSVMPKKKNAR
eukprot:9477767-Pyramimonas_sp.AAC.1